MDDDVGFMAIDVSDFQEDRSLVGAHDHGEPVAEVPDSDRVPVCVEDLGLVESVLERGRREDGCSITTPR